MLSKFNQIESRGTRTSCETVISRVICAEVLDISYHSDLPYKRNVKKTAIIQVPGVTIMLWHMSMSIWNDERYYRQKLLL